MKKNIFILGINESHGASAVLLKNGKIISAVSEERFTKIKNQSGFPYHSVNYCLKSAKISPKQLASINFGYIHPLGLMTQKRNKKNIYSLLVRISEILQELLNLSPVISYLTLKTRFLLYSKFFLKKTILQHNKTIADKFRVSPEIIHNVDHQTAHAYAAYYSKPDNFKKDALVVTLDGSGDGFCSRIFKVIDDNWHLLGSTESSNSLGLLYLYTTQYLAMKPNEHEYKVMGLAPYAHVKDIEKVLNVFRGMIRVDGTQLKSHIPQTMMYKYIKKHLAGFRFDSVAGGIQAFAEEIILQLISNSIRISGIKNVLLSGGVFMNVKANMLISELPSVEDLFIMPSCTDESVAIGAAYYGYREYVNSKSLPFTPKPLKNLYLGPSYTNKEIFQAIKQLKKNNSDWRITFMNDPAKTIAHLLLEGKIVARYFGKMEFGARALGNRSILARADNSENVRIINEQIKGRDFWMPFAPVILKERVDSYLINNKKLESPFMMLAFRTTQLAKNDLKAAIHPYDFTTRPQIIEKKAAADYYKILKEFEKLTGIGGLLNTSFNIHGFPIVCSPKDAIDTFKNSGLRYLALGNYLLQK